MNSFEVPKTVGEPKENKDKEKKSIKKKDKINELTEVVKTGQQSCKCTGDVSPLLSVTNV